MPLLHLKYWYPWPSLNYKFCAQARWAGKPSAIAFCSVFIPHDENWQIPEGKTLKLIEHCPHRYQTDLIKTKDRSCHFTCLKSSNHVSLQPDKSHVLKPLHHLLATSLYYYYYSSTHLPHFNHSGLFPSRLHSFYSFFVEYIFPRLSYDFLLILWSQISLPQSPSLT